MFSYDEAELEAFFTHTRVLSSGRFTLDHGCQLKSPSFEVAVLYNLFADVVRSLITFLPILVQNEIDSQGRKEP